MFSKLTTSSNQIITGFHKSISNKLMITAALKCWELCFLITRCSNLGSKKALSNTRNVFWNQEWKMKVKGATSITHLWTRSWQTLKLESKETSRRTKKLCYTSTILKGSSKWFFSSSRPSKRTAAPTTAISNRTTATYHCTIRSTASWNSSFMSKNSRLRTWCYILGSCRNRQLRKMVQWDKSTILLSTSQGQSTIITTSSKIKFN